MSKSVGAGQLSVNAKKVSANAKSSLAAFLTLYASFFLNTFASYMKNFYK